MIEESRLTLLDLLRNHAYREGVFKLASGRTSNFYINTKKITGLAQGANLIAEIILNIIAEDKIDAVGGLETGVNAMLGAIAVLSYLKEKPVSTFYVRKELKEHGTREWIEGPVPQKGKVAIIDDVTTTGGSILKAIRKVLENTDCEIVKVITLVDRLEGARENLADEGYDLISIFTIDDLRNAAKGRLGLSEGLSERRAVT